MENRLAKKPKIEETTEYESLLNVKEFEPGTLSSFLGEEEVKQIDEKMWKQHWHGMPEFKQEDNPPYKRLIISFRNDEDYKEFAKLLEHDQTLSDKTKTIWYPKLDREANMLTRWIEEE